MIKFVAGDILRTKTQYLAQSVAVGSQEGLGTGLALKISKKWADAQKQFKRFTLNNKFDGGNLFVAPPEESRPGIIYIATQPDMYHAALPFLNKGLRNLSAFCLRNKVESVSLPKIGAGLGKLGWETEVKPLMLKHLQAAATLFPVYEDFKDEHEK